MYNKQRMGINFFMCNAFKRDGFSRLGYSLIPLQKRDPEKH